MYTNYKEIQIKVKESLEKDNPVSMFHSVVELSQLMSLKTDAMDEFLDRLILKFKEPLKSRFKELKIKLKELRKANDLIYADLGTINNLICEIVNDSPVWDELDKIEKEKEGS